MQRVYELMPILDDPRYEGFGSARPIPFPTTETFLHNCFCPSGPIRDRNWRVPRLSSIWVPVRVAGRVREFNDYPCVNMQIPAFSARAIHALRDLLEPNGEILPLAASKGEYCAFNVTTVVDVLDRERSEIDWFTNDANEPDTSSIARGIIRYEFREQALESLSIFRICERPSLVFVTQTFVDRVRQHDLDGFDFVWVWPLPPGVSWKQLREQDRQRRFARGLPKGRTLKGNSLFIQLRTKGQPTPEQKRRVEQIMDELDALLFEPNSKLPPLGSLEGHEWTDEGCVLVLSCPDADALSARLLPWLKTVNRSWPCTVIKRYGEYMDHQASRQSVEL